MEGLIEKAMEFDQVDFNDLKIWEEYLLAIEPDGSEFGGSFAIVTCVEIEKEGDDVYYIFVDGDFMRDGVVFYTGGFEIFPDERIKLYNWPPPIDGTGGQNTVNPSGGGTGNTRRMRKRKTRKSRKRGYK
jgi:hypothetical protein